MTTTLPAGVYRHYKADRHYLVLGLAHDANDDDRTAVVYVPLYVDPAQPGPRLAVRTLADFAAWVDPATRQDVTEGTPGAVRRFTFVPELSSETT